MADILTQGELQQALVTDNPHMPPKDKFAFADKGAPTNRGLEAGPELIEAAKQQAFYENAINNGLQGIEGTPTNDQIMKAYAAKTGLNTIINDPNGTDWESVDAYKENYADDLKNINQPVDDGDVALFLQDQAMDNIDRETESGGQPDYDNELLSDEEDLNVDLDVNGNEAFYDEATDEYYDSEGSVATMPDVDTGNPFEDMTDQERMDMEAAGSNPEADRLKRKEILKILQKNQGKGL